MNVHIAAYTYNADTWCEHCLPVDKDNLEEVGVLLNWDEVDEDVYCNACGNLLLETGYRIHCTECYTLLACGYSEVQLNTRTVCETCQLELESEEN